MLKQEKAYDLEERTAKFGESIVLFVRKITVDYVSRPIISQLIRSATSIGANYMEADGAESKKDFIHKISICKKESKETMHWLRMLAKANIDISQKCRELWKEAHELALIFSKITMSK
jgi:four helix bundle protein